LIAPLAVTVTLSFVLVTFTSVTEPFSVIVITTPLFESNGRGSPCGNFTSTPPCIIGAVIMTHHYVHDLPLLSGLRTQPLAYLGLLGPRARAERLLRDADALGGAEAVNVPSPGASVLHAPVGLDLGGDGPAAVALAIVAEIQTHLSGRDARPLRQRREPIHSR
jgi:xanthine/CO dehydrogenase XdhC/CoxF family maturation factor